MENESQIDPDKIYQHLEKIAAMLDVDDIDGVDICLESLEPVILTLVLSRLTREQKHKLVSSTQSQKAARYIHEMPDAQTTGVVQALPVAVAAKILEELPKFEQADIVSELSPTDQDCILAELPKDSATVVRQLVNYESDEAGGLMTVRYVAVRENDSVASIVNQLQKNAATYSDFAVQYIYVVDASGKLLGVVPLRSLVLTTPETLVQEIMISNPLAVRTDDDLLTLHEFFEGHQFVGVPVVEENFTLVGVLRRGDVEEAISKRNAFDYLKTQGIVNEELRTMPLTLRSRRRLAWLSINIMLNLFAAGVIAFYQETLEQVIALAVFLPIISDMSGCSGNQAVAVSMRELSLGLVSSKEVMRVWFKEIGVGLINGICLGVFIATLAFIWKGNPWLGLVVGAAMSANTIIAVSIGGTLPLIMRRFNLDPALASGPILTTVTDMCGFFLVLSGASLLLEKLIDV